MQCRSVRGGTAAAVAFAASLLASEALAATTITIESWRKNDVEIWNSQIIPAFKAKHPDIDVQFQPSVPTEYNAGLDARLRNGTAGDLITCRPFDPSLDLYNRGRLAPLSDLPGLENFSDVAKSAWTTDDGKTTFCVPMASVIHGFIYNRKIFDELKLAPPKTLDEFHALLGAIKTNGGYTPLDLGTADQWEAATMGFQNIGPNFWKGEEGRKPLVAGASKFTDAPYVAAWGELARWAPYLAEGYREQKYAESQSLFLSGKAAIYPAGSWEIPPFETGAIELGAFPPPVAKAGDTCYISDHPNIGIGLNTRSAHADAARTFLTWVASPEFATIYANALPGFIPLSSTPVEIEDPLAQEFASWRQNCKSTIRNSYQRLSRGTPNLENELWIVSAEVINGTMKPEDAARQIQMGLDSWYKPTN